MARRGSRSARLREPGGAARFWGRMAYEQLLYEVT